MLLSEQSHAFVIKIWHERRDIVGAEPVWRGSVNDVEGGPRVYFNSLATLHAGIGDCWPDADEEIPHAPRP